MKPYLTNKGALCTTDINLIENENIIINELEIANIFNDHYTNVVKYSSGISPTNIADKLPPGTKFDDILGEILNEYKDHPSINTIKTKKSYNRTFTCKPVTTNDVFKLLKNLDAKKAIGIDEIPPMILKLSAHILAEPLTKIINKCIVDCDFPTLAKLAFILPFFKKGERSQKKNYRPVSVLSAL